MRLHPRAAARPLIVAGAVLAGLALAGVAPAVAAPLAQKAGAAGCIGEAPCTVGVETFMAQSVAVSPDGRHAYAAAISFGSVTVFDRLADGTLRQKSGTAGCISARAAELLPGYCAPGSAIEGAFSVAVSPDGRNVYVASLFSSAVAIFDRAANGTLTQKPASAGCVSETGAAPCADGTGLQGVRSVTVSANGASVYAAATDSGAIAVFDRAANGALTQKAGLDGCVSETGSGPCADGRALTRVAGLAASADSASVYAVSADGVAVFDRRDNGTLAQPAGAGGCVSATLAGCASGRAMSTPSALAVSPDGSGVYVAARESSAVAVFDRGTGGALTQKPGTAGCISSLISDAGCAAGIGLAETTGVTVSPEGASVYVASKSTNSDYGILMEGPGSIANFDRSADGALTQPSGADGCVSDAGAADACSDATRHVRGAASLAISPDGRSAYLATFSGLVIFDRGEPLPAPPPPPPPPPADVTGPLLRGLAVAPARFRAGTRGPAVATRGGTKISFRVDEAAALRFTVQHVVTGRRAGARCVPLRASNRAAKRCERYRLLAGSFASIAAPGANALRFSGRLRNRRLAAGRYRLRAVARDAAGNRSRAKVARFAIRR